VRADRALLETELVERHTPLQMTVTTRLAALVSAASVIAHDRGLAMLRMLLAEGADPNRDSNPNMRALRLALEGDDAAAVGVLLEGGADPLHFAISATGGVAEVRFVASFCCRSTRALCLGGACGLTRAGY
jgi:hypothetical protein